VPSTHAQRQKLFTNHSVGVSCATICITFGRFGLECPPDFIQREVSTMGSVFASCHCISIVCYVIGLVVLWLCCLLFKLQSVHINYGNKMGMLSA
jgi:hypothetical protein